MPAGCGVWETNLATGERVASTSREAAAQRCRLLRSLGATSALELCVGPSLQTMKEEGLRVGLVITGNDIDPRWAPDLLGDCLRVPWDADAVVHAPPLSRGCTGRREDSLGVAEVVPSYGSFLDEWERRGGPGIAVLVLPGRTMSLREDRTGMWRLIARLRTLGEVRADECRVGARAVTKYVYLSVVKR